MSVVVVRTHKLVEPFWSQYTRLVAEVGRTAVYLLWDVTNAEIPQSVLDFHRGAEDHIIRITEDQCKRMNSLHTTVYEMCDTLIVIIADYLNNKRHDYEYLWLIEYDVTCSGNWKRTLAKAENCTEDLLATYVEQYTPANQWLWGRLYGEMRTWAHTAKEWKGFLPALRISRRSIENCLRPNMNRASGFLETYITTALINSGFTIGNMPFSMVGQWFNCFNIPGPQWKLIEAANPDSDCLWHSVKSL